MQLAELCHRNDGPQPWLVRDISKADLPAQLNNGEYSTLLGLVTNSDIRPILATKKSPQSMTAPQLMSRRPVTTTSDTSVVDKHCLTQISDIDAAITNTNVQACASPWRPSFYNNRVLNRTTGFPGEHQVNP